MTKLVLFFSYGVSLKTWSDTGLLQRELALYQELTKKGIEVAFITYGDKTDRQWEDQLGNIKLLPFYEQVAYPRKKTLRLFQTLIMPWIFRKELGIADIYKTNQMSGAWTALLAKFMFKKSLLLRSGYELTMFQEFQREVAWKKFLFNGLLRVGITD